MKYLGMEKFTSVKTDKNKGKIRILKKKDTK